MTNQQKAESCGEFTRIGIDALQDLPYEPVIGGWALDRDCVVEAASQAGHWGRLALAEQTDNEIDEAYFRERERRWLATWGQIIKTSIDRGLSAQAGGDATIAFHRARLYFSQATGFGDYQ
ncbi:hypothetical protein LCGC14_0609940 [marine sediment metagenome]|uniref:Uncharacterized protein n=1 Tax=marine sediment metagenome TaxID=412755 RepID=A0A0F9UGG3_9ZZZZ